MHAIDPSIRRFDVEECEAHLRDLCFHRARSLDALPDYRARLDAVLIDGDHNWYTVFHELSLLDGWRARRERAFPLVLLHDVGWPYARRDLYYEPRDPEALPATARARGVAPGFGGLRGRGGANPTSAHARREGGPQNGVLTAVEDFCADRNGLRLLLVDGFHGLGVLVPETTLERRPELRDLLTRLESEDVLRAHVAAVERGRVEFEAAHGDLRARLAQQKARAAAAERAHRRLQRVRDAEVEAAQRRHWTAVEAAEHVRRRAEDDLRRLTARTEAAEAELRTLAASPIAAETGPLQVLFVLPAESGGGGSHSVVQEARGLRELGVDVQIAVEARNRERYLFDYPGGDREGLFWFYDSLDEVVTRAGRFDCAIATIFHSVRLVQMIVERHPRVVPAYYVQDYEPWFFDADADAEWRRVAEESYALIPDMLVFAKTQWLCDLVRRRHGVDVHRVQPSLDTRVYFPRPRRRRGAVRVAAMIRPSTSYRGAERTLRVLERLRRELGQRVVVETFGSKGTKRGALRREEVGELLRGCDVFVDFSEWQAFGRTALEAAACGCAVVVPALGGAGEHVEHGVTGLVVDTRARRCLLCGSSRVGGE